MNELLAAAWINLDALVEAIQASVDYPWTQGFLTAFATLFFENVVCWTIVPPLISEGIMGTLTALHGTFWGVFLGDLLMYLPVRFAMRYVMRLRWVRRHQKQIAACARFFDNHLGKTMFIVRFTPGIRTPALLAAGMLRVHFGLYVLYSALSSLLQSAIVVFFMPTLYAPAIAWLKALWADRPGLVILLVTAFFVAFGVAQGYVARAAMRRITGERRARQARVLERLKARRLRRAQKKAEQEQEQNQPLT